MKAEAEEAHGQGDRHAQPSSSRRGDHRSASDQTPGRQSD
jgi:hypothetical protein